MILNKENLIHLAGTANLTLPDPHTFTLPEKVLQFGTGVLLRGLPDYFIDKANRQGIFNGRVVVVKSTDKGNTTIFDAQDSLYTIAVRGIDGTEKTEENIISSAISRVLTAQTDWQAILDLAASADLQIVTSNTTESGIQFATDDVLAYPPVSFPGKLLAVLYHRFKAFSGDENRGLVIVPAELISDNGTLLREIVIKMAATQKLDPAFINWIAQHNTFCNTLVDRIVPGKPDEATLQQLEKELGYEDNLLIVTEVYRLWAIEGDAHVKAILSFEQADPGVVIVPDITIHKELKLRLLNGTHTLSCAVASLAGIETVSEAMNDTQLTAFITGLMQDDLARAIPYPVTAEAAMTFSNKVLDRFRNSHIEHHWLSISTNYTMKLKMRAVPVLLQYYTHFNSVPEYIALGFAAWLRFMRVKAKGGVFFGSINDKEYVLDDEQAAYFGPLWRNSTAETVVDEVLSNTLIWDTDLAALPGFADSVKDYLQVIEINGIRAAIKITDTKRISA